MRPRRWRFPGRFICWPTAPDYQERARDEAPAQLKGRPPAPEDLAAMPLVKQVLEEAMRLYPPVGLLARTVVAEDELCGRIDAAERHLVPADLGAASPRIIVGAAGLNSIPTVLIPTRGPARQISISSLRRGPARLRGRQFRHDAGADHPGHLGGAFQIRPSLPAPHPVMTMTVRPDPGIFVELEEAA